MRPKSLVLLVLALGCGLAASIGISQLMDANANRPTVELSTTPIYVAQYNINLNDPIDASMVSLQDWPTDKLPQGAFTSIDELEGRRPRTTVVAGTPILEAQLLAVGETADPVGNIPDGFRLSTIAVNAEKSAAGLLSPGDRVDIQLYVNANPRAGIPEAKTKVILQNIRVFAIEQAVQRSAEGEEAKAIPKTVSLLVSPEQASRIALAMNLGELSLIPRNPNDEATANVSEITASDLLGDGSSESNNREEEQNREKQPARGPSVFDSVVGLMSKAAKERPPFEMTIVEAEEVRSMRFDRTTGAPLRGEQDALSQGRRTQASNASFTPDGRIDFTDKKRKEIVSGVNEGDFPIEFGNTD